MFAYNFSVCLTDEWWDTQVRSINGVRVTERILQLVPDKDQFRTTLIAIKHWARVRTPPLCRVVDSRFVAFVLERLFMAMGMVGAFL